MTELIALRLAIAIDLPTLVAIRAALLPGDASEVEALLAEFWTDLQIRGGRLDPDIIAAIPRRLRAHGLKPRPHAAEPSFNLRLAHARAADIDGLHEECANQSRSAAVRHQTHERLIAVSRVLAVRRQASRLGVDGFGWGKVADMSDDKLIREARANMLRRDARKAHDMRARPEVVEMETEPWQTTPWGTQHRRRIGR
jgi:hypothetical protein